MHKLNKSHNFSPFKSYHSHMQWHAPSRVYIVRRRCQDVNFIVYSLFFRCVRSNSFYDGNPALRPIQTLFNITKENEVIKRFFILLFWNWFRPNQCCLLFLSLSLTQYFQTDFWVVKFCLDGTHQVYLLLCGVPLTLAESAPQTQKRKIWLEKSEKYQHVLISSHSWPIDPHRVNQHGYFNFQPPKKSN